MQGEVQVEDATQRDVDAPQEDADAPQEGAHASAAASQPVARIDVARDSALLRRLRGGEMDAYGELVRRHARRAYSLAYGVLRHREDAEDAVQESFARTLDMIDRIDESRPFHPWFYRIVVNTAISLHRSRTVRQTSQIRDDVASPAAAPDRTVELDVLRRTLLRALDTLPEKQRAIVLLADMEGFNSAEIGEIMAMPAGTVRYELHLARRRLRQALPGLEEEAG
jgi:RNA polymerase sigma-70 factor, ECF subfamily